MLAVRTHCRALALAGAVALAAAQRAQAAGDSDEVNPYRKTYLTLELARNYPVSFSQNEFEAGRYGFIVGYRYNLDPRWLMGLSAGFKSLERKDRGDAPTHRLALWTVTHETLFSIRLDHPTYLLLGPKLHYLLPAHAAKFPLQRADEFETEIGIALSAALAHVVGGRYLVTARLDRWRGTRTMTFHGLEMAVGVSVGLD